MCHIVCLVHAPLSLFWRCTVVRLLPTAAPPTYLLLQLLVKDGMSPHPKKNEETFDEWRALFTKARNNQKLTAKERERFRYLTKALQGWLNKKYQE